MPCVKACKIAYNFVMLVKIMRTDEKVVKIKVNGDCLEVIANKYASDKKIKKILAENAEWINRRVALSAQSANADVVATAGKRSLPENVEYSDVGVAEIFAGRAFLLCGKTYRVAPSEGAKIYIDGGNVFVPQKYCKDKLLRIKALRSYSKRLAEVYLSAEISKFGSSISLCPKKIEYRDLKTTWLKCSMAAERIICMDYRAVSLPLNLQQYLIVHAFVHFDVPEHGNAFWNAVSNYLPKYSDVRAGLKRYAFLFDV